MTAVSYILCGTDADKEIVLWMRRAYYSAYKEVSRVNPDASSDFIRSQATKLIRLVLKRDAESAVQKTGIEPNPFVGAADKLAECEKEYNIEIIRKQLDSASKVLKSVLPDPQSQQRAYDDCLGIYEYFNGTIESEISVVLGDGFMVAASVFLTMPLDEIQAWLSSRRLQEQDVVPSTDNMESSVDQLKDRMIDSISKWAEEVKKSIKE